MNRNLSIKMFKDYELPIKRLIDTTLKKEIHQSNKKLIILDDDPTGIQTIHGVSVFTDWDLESIRKGFSEKKETFFILTNSRACTEKETRKIYQDISERVLNVSKETKKDYLIICRGDSTLRGHFPLETEVIREVMKEQVHDIDGEVLCPFFDDGGRYTIDDVHYVRYGDDLVPVGQTEFAGDKTFHFTSSNLKDYIEEKTNGKYKAEAVSVISLKELRELDFDGIAQKLLNLNGFHKMIVNAVSLYDIKVFCIALYRAMRSGKRYLFRTAASFVNGISGIEKKPLMNREDLKLSVGNNGGIIIVGSHTEKTTTQLMMLEGLEKLVLLEMNSDLVLSDGLEAEVERLSKECSKLIGQGKTPVVYTKRRVLNIQDATREQALTWAVKISDGVQRIVADLTEAPSFVIAKGGITSSDIGTKALKVKRADVMGQIEPGVSVWKLGEESRFPHIPYVIFPGNVGDGMSLRNAVEKLLDIEN